MREHLESLRGKSGRKDQWWHCGFRVAACGVWWDWGSCSKDPLSSMTAKVQCGLLSREDGIQTHTQLFFMAWDTQERV